jgi:hypothetical protein
MSADFASIPTGMIGHVKGDALPLEGEAPLSLEELRAFHEGWLPDYMSGEE